MVMRSLLLGLVVLGGCEVNRPLEFGPPVGIQFDVAGMAVEVALAVSKPHQPAPVVEKVAELLAAALPVCADALAELHSGQVLRFSLSAKASKIVASNAGAGSPEACLGRAALGRPSGAPDDLSLLLEVREKAR